MVKVSEAELHKYEFARVSVGHFNFLLVRLSTTELAPVRIDSRLERRNHFRIVDSVTGASFEIPGSFYRSEI